MTTKNDLIGRVAEQEKLPKDTVTTAVNATFKAIADGLARGEEVKIAGLGIFDVRPTKGRIGRNPATGESLEIPAGKKIRFRPSSDLRERL